MYCDGSSFFAVVLGLDPGLVGAVEAVPLQDLALAAETRIGVAHVPALLTEV